MDEEEGRQRVLDGEKDNTEKTLFFLSDLWRILRSRFSLPTSLALRGLR